jgi:chaperonin GroEL
LILVTDNRIETVDQILPALELIARDARPLLIVAEEIEGQALAALVMNTVRGTMKVAAVKAPFYGTHRRGILADLAISTGAEFFSRDSTTSLKDIKLSHFGQCRSIDITKGLTTLVGGKGSTDEIESRIELLKGELINTDELQECEKIQERINKLVAGVAVINVGAPTEVEMIEKKHRVEDALEAVKSAQAEGVVCGGGVALLKAQGCLDSLEYENEDQGYGAEIVRRALSAPLRQMAMNSGLSPDLIEAEIKEAPDNYGYNFRDFKVVDMMESGIIDPAKVTRVALQNAGSAAGLLITTSHAIVEV